MFGITYSKNTGRIRSVFVPDKDSDLDLVNLNQGEAFMKCDQADYGHLHELQDFITKKTGLIPTDDRFVLVDNQGDVKGVIIADLACGDAVENHELILHATATIGWKYNSVGKVFTPPLLPISDQTPKVIQ